MMNFAKALGAILFLRANQGAFASIPEPIEVQEIHSSIDRNLQGCGGNYVQNSDGTDLTPWVGSRSTLTNLEAGWQPGSQALKSSDRIDLNSGPLQYLTPGVINCFTQGLTATFTMRLRLEDQSGNGFACSTSAWNQPNTCPLLSLRVEQADGTSAWLNSWNQANLPASGGWQANSWNEYTTSFTVTADMVSAQNIYFMIRGPASSLNVFLSDPVFTVAGATSIAPTPLASSSPSSLASGSPSIEGTFAPSIDSSGAPSTTSSPSNIPSISIFPSISSAPSLAPTPAVTCDLGFANGDFENGNADIASWTTNKGGNITLYDTSSEGDGSQLFALKITGRETPQFGPKHTINTNCFHTGYVLEIHAFIKLENSTDQSPYFCDAFAGPISTCPVLTLETQNSGHFSYKYADNVENSEWDASGFNEYKGYFHLDETISSATSGAFYFERPPPGIDIIMDNLTVREFQPIPLGNVHAEGDDFVYANCNDLVTNGDAELGDTSGWSARLGGHLTIRPEGADGTAFSFQHSGRTSFIMGPKHALKTQCFVEGMRYVLDAKIKLLDEDDIPFQCDKTHTWVDADSCPLLTFQLTDVNGDRSWKYYGNESPNDWNSAIWNPFNAFFTITEDIATAATAYFYVERPRAGISLIIDQVSISRDCTTLIANSDAENGSLSGWSLRDGAGGQIVIHPEGADGSMNSYGHFGRTAIGGGPSHIIDLGCLVLGRQYEFTAKFKLLDENNNMTSYHCRNDVAWGDPQLCPLFSITMIDSAGNPTTPLNIANIDPSTIFADNFNSYKAIFTVDQAMATATEARIVIKGVRPGVATLLDDIEINLYEPPQYDCDALIPNGDFENGDYSRFDIRHSGSLQIYPDGYGNGQKSLLVVERTMVGSGLRVDLNTTCLVEGRRYKFEAQMKLLTSGGDPFDCLKSKGYADPLACPLFGFEFNNGGTQTAYYSNEDPTIFNSTLWNPYSVIFTVSNALANADSAFFMLTGPAPNIGIAVDRVSFDEYIPPQADCSQIVQNGNAESGSMSGWKVNGGGHIGIISGGDNGSAHAYAQTARTARHFGPKQDIPPSCLNTAGDQYIFSAQLKLEDSLGNPFACDKAAAWATALTCPLLSVEIQHPIQGMKRYHFGNTFNTAWDASGWNSYHASITLDQDIVEADSAFWFLQGPDSGISIIFDNVALTPATSP